MNINVNDMWKTTEKLRAKYLYAYPTEVRLLFFLDQTVPTL